MIGLCVGRGWQYHRDGEEVRWREGKDIPPGRAGL